MSWASFVRYADVNVTFLYEKVMIVSDHFLVPWHTGMMKVDSFLYFRAWLDVIGKLFIPACIELLVS